MSKPDQALELRPVADLTFHSLAQSIDLVTKDYNAQGMCIYEASGYWLIKVASQNLPDAIVLAYASTIRVEVDFTYKEDEWSTSYICYDFSENKYVTHNVTAWSPGA